MIWIIAVIALILSAWSAWATWQNTKTLQDVLMMIDDLNEQKDGTVCKWGVNANDRRLQKLR